MLQCNNVTKMESVMGSTVIVPDNRGRVLLGKVIDQVADHYLATVDDHGIITLVPAVVRPKMLDDVMSRDPELIERIREFEQSGEQALPSEVWDQIKAESGTDL